MHRSYCKYAPFIDRYEADIQASQMHRPIVGVMLCLLEYYGRLSDGMNP